MARPRSSDSSNSPRNRWTSADSDNEPTADDLGDTRLRDIADNYVPKVLDKFEDGVATVRQLTTDRAVSVLGYLIFGLGMAVAGIVGVLCLLIITVRLADVYGPGPLWAWYLGMAGLFSVVGVFLWHRSSPRSSTDA